MGHVWHYTDAKGERKEESMTDAQQAADANAVSTFQRLESLHANGQDVNADTASVEQLRALVEVQSPERKKYWAAEMARIGITDAATDSKKPKPKKPAATEGEGGAA